MLRSSSAIASAASTATFCVSTVLVTSAMSCIFSSTYFASFCTYLPSSSPWMEYTCPKICTFIGALMFQDCSAERSFAEHLFNWSSTGAELRAKMFFECRNNFAAVIADLRFGQRRLAALERHAHQQRIFSGGNIFPAEKVSRFDR